MFLKISPEWSLKTEPGVKLQAEMSVNKITVKKQHKLRLYIFSKKAYRILIYT